MMEFAPYMYLDTSKYQRVVVMSDIHGDVDGFLGTLKKAEFSDEDALIIVGDILEKGDKNLALIRLVKEMCKKGNTFMLLGNNDTQFSNWRKGVFSDEGMFEYAQKAPKSTVLEMGRELGLGWGSVEEVTRLHKAIFEHYADEIAFLDALPYIVETEFAIFVHAGLKEGPLTEQDPDYCTSASAFGISELSFHKPVIVGHWPASNYCENIICVDPYFNSESNIVSIDGGNSLKSWGQINYLVFKNGELADIGRYDSLPKIRLLEAQRETKSPTLLIFPHTRVEILEERGEETLCFVPYLEREMLVPAGKIYEYRGNFYRWDYTDYHPPISAGEIVSLCQTDDYGTMIKKNGIVGYYNGSWEYVK